MIDLEPLQASDERRGDHSFKRGSTDQASYQPMNDEDDLLISSSGYKAKRPPGFKR